MTEKTYQVDIPAGVDTGSTLRLTGRGAVGPRNGSAGDLYVHIRVANHERFVRDGDDLFVDLPVSIAQASLGTKFLLPTLDGDEEIVVPAGTQPGKEFVIRGRGVTRLQGRGRGDLRVRVKVEVPTKLSECRGRSAASFRRGSRRARACRAGPVLTHKVSVLMNPLLRNSEAHVFVDSLSSPQLAFEDEHHLDRSLRLEETDPVSVSDGQGRWATATWSRRRGLELTSQVHADKERPSLTVGCAIPKGDRPELVVQKLTELGINRISFYETSRSVVHWDAERRSKQSERLNRIAREAAMQSRRTFLPRIEFTTFERLLEQNGMAIAEPGGRDPIDEVGHWRARSGPRVASSATSSTTRCPRSVCRATS